MLSILRSVQGAAKAEPQCVGCQLFEEDGQDEAVLYMERWESEHDLNRHIRSEPYGGIMAAVEPSRIPAEFSFHHVERTRGMEQLEEVEGSIAGGETHP
jgi:quinol monooxygenase YgiN